MQQNNLEFWIDVNHPPAMAKWIQEDFGIPAKSSKELNFDIEQHATIFNCSKKIKYYRYYTKDVDFKNLSEEINICPKILYLNVGNISNKLLKEIFYKSIKDVITLF